MPNIKSAAKRDALAKAQNAVNRAKKTEMKTQIKKFNAAASEGDREAANAAYKVAVSSVDRAASDGILHKNNAARKKSQLTLKLNAISK